jgi:xylulokinase
LHVLGIDIGTSAVKLLLVDAREAVVAATERPLVTQRPRPDWSEQDPEDWWRAVEDGIDHLRRIAAGAFAEVGAIGLSGQMHGAVLLGANDSPLRPAILWNDARALDEAAELASRHPDLPWRVGVRPMAGFTAPKLPWLARHEPEILDRLRTILLPKDYIRLKLTGDRLTDMSDAAGTWWLDEARRAWDPEALAATGTEPAWLPPLCEGSAAAGRLRADLARRWGLPRDVGVAGGAGDAAAGAVGIGAVGEGDAFVSLGTSAQLFVTTETYRPAPDTLVHAFAHALPGRWYQMGAMLNGASVLASIAGLVGSDVGDLAAQAEAAYRGPQRLLMLPYLTGERTPHDDPRARGVIFGLDPAATAADLAQAAMEGVAFAVRDGREALAQSGTHVAELGLIGGGARSLLWTRILAAVLDVPVRRYRGGDRGPAFGAARLARLALGGTTMGTACPRPETLDLTIPEAALVDAYRPRYEKFRRLYKALRDEFRMI